MVAIFPDRAEWLVASRRYLSGESLKVAQMPVEEEEVVPELAAAS